MNPSKFTKSETAAAHSELLRHDCSGEAGFSLIESLIAILLLTVGLLSVVSVFTFAVNYNTGNNLRSQALAVLQQETEMLRAARFTPNVTDAVLSGGVKNQKTVTAPGGAQFFVNITVDDDPFTSGVQVDSSKTLKEIRVAVTIPENGQRWASAVPMENISRRVRAN